MNPLLEEIQGLIQNSLALQGDSAERIFWTEHSKLLSEEQLNRLKAVLVQEADAKAKIEKEYAERIAKIEAQHLEELQHFKRVELPQFLKKWERIQTEKENPEDILNQMNNA